MDTFKKEIYIEARRLLESGEEKFLCHAIRVATCNITGMYCSANMLNSLFPELLDMEDENFWFSPNIIYCLPKERRGTRTAWWEAPWPEPRLRMIDYLLSR